MTRVFWGFCHAEKKERIFPFFKNTDKKVYYVYVRFNHGTWSIKRKTPHKIGKNLHSIYKFMRFKFITINMRNEMIAFFGKIWCKTLNEYYITFTGKGKKIVCWFVTNGPEGLGLTTVGFSGLACEEDLVMNRLTGYWNCWVTCDSRS